MYSLPVLSGLLALAMARSALSSPLEELLDARAAPSRTCRGYAVQQVSACPTNTAFCSRFLASFPPVATTTTSTTITSTSATTTTATTSTDTITETTDADVGFCTSNFDSKKKRVAEAAAPTAFGPSCNVKEIQGTKVENACSCLPQFTYSGKRPKATTTSTVTVTATTSTVSVSTVNTAAVATHTALKFIVYEADYSVSSFVGRQWFVDASQSTLGWENQAPDDIGPFFRDLQNNDLWSGRIPGNDSFFTIFGAVPQEDYVSTVRINRDSPNEPPDAGYVPLRISFDYDDASCPRVHTQYLNGTDAFIYKCFDHANNIPYIAVSNNGFARTFPANTDCDVVPVAVQHP